MSNGPFWMKIELSEHSYIIAKLEVADMEDCATYDQIFVAPWR